MISPSIGRVVWYRESADQNLQPQAGIVVFVHDDRLVNLTVFNKDGYPVAKPNTVLLQDDDVAPWHGNYAEWMPFQKGQAAKTESLEARIEPAQQTAPAAQTPAPAHEPAAETGGSETT